MKPLLLCRIPSPSSRSTPSARLVGLQYQGLIQTDQAAIDTRQASKPELLLGHITAPVSGRVGLRQVDQGNYVTPGDAAGLVVLTQIKPITVIFTLPEDTVPAVTARLRAGDAIPIDAFDRNQTHKIAAGVLGTIDNQVDTIARIPSRPAPFSPA